MRARPLALTLSTLLFACERGVGDGDGVVTEDEIPMAGWTGVFETLAHETAGTATVLDDGTLQITGWTYDGEGVDARLFLTTDGAEFQPDFELTGNLVGSPAAGETLDLAIPADATPGTWDSVVLWCLPFRAAFGFAKLSPP